MCYFALLCVFTVWWWWWWWWWRWSYCWRYLSFVSEPFQFPLENVWKVTTSQASQMPGTLFNKLFPIGWCISSQVLVFAVTCWCTPFVHFIHLLPWKTCYWCWLPVAIPCDNEGDCQIELWQKRQELNCWTAWSDRVILKGNEFIHVGRN